MAPRRIQITAAKVIGVYGNQADFNGGSQSILKWGSLVCRNHFNGPQNNREDAACLYCLCKISRKRDKELIRCSKDRFLNAGYNSPRQPPVAGIGTYFLRLNT